MQVEIRKSSPRGYFYNIVWVEPVMCAKGSTFSYGPEDTWTVVAVFGSRMFPGRKPDSFCVAVDTRPEGVYPVKYERHQ